ncbi:MAG TPA: Rad52/Rad22 family DNA repair protein [Terriglobales bacterium]
MPTEDKTTSASGLEVNKLLLELEVPFPPDQVRWRVTNTTNDKKRGQVVPYADSRAYTDRLNALFTPQGWTREYKVQTMTNITRIKKGESILSGKVLVTCTVTVLGIGSHSGTGEEWADDDNGMTSADAQAFKRSCSCFGLGRYFYDIPPIWVDLDQNRQPMKTPALFAWALPENWRKGMRPPGKNRNGNANAPNHGIRSNGGSNGNHGQATKSQTRPTDGGGNGDAQTAQANGSAAGSGDDLDARILGLEKAVGTALFRGILREYGRVNQPKLIRDAAIKGKVLQMLESATRGLDRLEAVSQRLDPNTVKGLLDKLQVPPLDEIADIKTLQNVVFGLEELAGSDQHHAA